jgi:hypothetical protein
MLHETDYVVYEKHHDSALQDSQGRVILYGNITEAQSDCEGNEVAIPCTELPIHWQTIILKQLKD